MKILLSGNHNPHFTNTVELREKAIRDLGHELIFFNDRSFILPGRLRGISSEFQNWDLRRMNKNLLSLVEKTRPDLCLVIGGHRILRETVLAIKEQKIKVFLWTTDVPIDFSNILKAAIFYDQIFCAGTEAIELLSERDITRVELLPFGCDPELHHRVELSYQDEKKYTKDIVFVGSFYNNRKKIIETISNLDLLVCGPGWGKVLKGSLLFNKIIDKRVNYDEWLKMYSAAKIVLAVHFDDNKTPSKQISPKVFEAMACGRMVISDRQEDVISIFKEDKHIVCYSDEEDLRNKLKYYLKNEEERNRIALGGYEEVIKKHKYSDRINRIIEKLNGVK